MLLIVIFVLVIVGIAAVVGFVAGRHAARTEVVSVTALIAARIRKVEREQEAWKTAVRSVVDRSRVLEAQGRNPRQLEEVQPQGQA